MNSSLFTKPTRFIMLFAVGVYLTACNFTLAEDVTPPPGALRAPTLAQTSAPAPSGPLYPIVPPDPLAGESLFAEKCAPCHGAEGLGDGASADQLPNPVIPVGSVQVARQATPAEWYRVVTNGNLERFMPPFPSLSDRQRWDVLAYTFSLSMPSERLLEGQELYQVNCASCHGQDGAGDGPSGATLAVPDFRDQEFMASKSAADFFQVITSGREAGMPAFGEQYSEDQRWALAEYLRSLTFSSTLAQASVPETPAETQAAAYPYPVPVEAQATAYPYPAPEEAPTEEVLMDTTPVSATKVLGTVSGVVINASGGDLPPGLPVDLFAFDHVQVVYSATIELDKDGSYLFENVEMPDGLVFLTTIDFQGATYGSEIGTPEGGTYDIVLPLQVYESTTDVSVLQVDRIHFFFEFLDGGALRVVELYIISNPSLKTLIAPREGDPVLAFSLPPEAQNLEFQDDVLGGRYLPTADGFGDTVPVRPGDGNYQVMFTYQMPYDHKLELSRPMSLPVEAIVILAPEDGVKIKGENIQDAGTRDVQGISYHMYNGGSLAAGQDLNLTLSGRPSNESLSVGGSAATSLVVGLGAFGIVLIAVGVWLYRRNAMLSEREDEPPEIPLDDAPQNANALMDAILALDDLYQEGELPEEAYLARRAELRARLSELLGS